MDILEEQINSRFEWGLMADIQSPDYETWMAILIQKGQQKDIEQGIYEIKRRCDNAKNKLLP